MELALVAPVLLLLVFATIDLGRAWAFHNRLSNAAREASFLLATRPRNVDCSGTTPDAQGAAESEDEELSEAAGYQVVVARQEGGEGQYTNYDGCSASGDPETGDHVRVTVSVEFRPITPIAGAFIDNPTILKRSAEVVVG